MLRNVRLLHIHNFLTDFCPQWPFLIIYFADITGSYTTGMSILALETVAAALFDIPTGIFSDKMGRRLTMASGSISCALGLACYAWGLSVSVL
jgi:MFS family permease